MCGASGPSSSELTAQSNAAKGQAEAEAAKLKAAQDLEKQKQAALVLADNVSTANADAARRARNRTLLAGVGNEESPFTAPALGTALEDPLSRSSKKAQLAKTLLAGIGG